MTAQPVRWKRAQTMATRGRAQRDSSSTTTTTATTASGQDDQSVEIGWGRWVGRFKGNGTIVIVVLAVSLYLLTLLLLRTADAPVNAIEAQTVTQSKEHATIQKNIGDHREMNEREHASLIRTQERIADSLDEQVFYLSKTEAERANYRIEMPDSLSRKLVERGMRYGPSEEQRNHTRDRNQRR